ACAPRCRGARRWAAYPDPAGDEARVFSPLSALTQNVWYCTRVMMSRPMSGVPMNVTRLLFRMFVPVIDHVTLRPGNGSRQLNWASMNAFTGTLPTYT